MYIQATGIMDWIIVLVLGIGPWIMGLGLIFWLIHLRDKTVHK